MIATVTLNPALDRTVYVEGFVRGDTNRIKKTELDAGGKGINASRMLAELGAETFALGFIGGRTGRFIEHVLAEEGILTAFVHTKAETRTNVDIQDLAGAPPTSLNEQGGPVTPEELAGLRNSVRQHAATSRIMILGGSVPQEVGSGVYAELIEIAQAEGSQIILDADDEALTLGLAARPMMIKPNIDEAQRLVGRDLRGVPSVAGAAKELALRYVRVAVISMGKLGAIAATSEGVWHAVPPQVEAISTVGSGDSMVAGIAFSLAEGKSMPEALALGSAAGAATAMSSGVRMGRKEDVHRLLSHVTIRRLS